MSLMELRQKNSSNCLLLSLSLTDDCFFVCSFELSFFHYTSALFRNWFISLCISIHFKNDKSKNISRASLTRLRIDMDGYRAKWQVLFDTWECTVAFERVQRLRGITWRGNTQCKSQEVIVIVVNSSIWVFVSRVTCYKRCRKLLLT